MTMGRPRKPSILKMLDGDFDHDPKRQNHAEPKVKRGCPTRPRHIQGIAKAEWQRITKILDANQVLTVDCGPAIEQYVAHYARWRESLKAIVANEATQTEQRIFRESSQFCHRWLAEFGLTPSSRTRIQLQQDTSSASELAERYLA